MFDAHRERLLQSLDEAHASFYRAGVFAGPSLYFHQQASAAAKDNNLERFTETVYAVLVAWGMHRMGGGGPKMCDFEVFSTSLSSQWSNILRLRHAAPENLHKPGWDELHEIFRGICCMKTGISLVGNSKVLAHALPNVVAPVDREYTVRFLYDGKKNIPKNLEKQWERFRAIHCDFYYPVLQAESFKAKAEEWLEKSDTFKWDTSPLKIVDNLVIGLMRIR